MRIAKLIQLMWLAGMLLILISGCKHSNINPISDKLEIWDSNYNLIVTSSHDFSTCIDKIIFGPRSTEKYHGVIFSHSKQTSLSDFTYVDETKDWINWQIIHDSEFFVKLLDFSEDRQTPLLFEIEGGKLKSARSVK